MASLKPSRFENKATFMRRCMGSFSTQARAEQDVREAIRHVSRQGATLLTGEVPDAVRARQEFCELVWRREHARFAAEAAFEKRAVAPAPGDFDVLGYGDDTLGYGGDEVGYA